MTEWLQLLLASMGGASATIGVQWLRSRAATAGTALNVGARLQEHWADTTLKLVETIQSQLHDALAELEPLRPVKAHLEEALDHLHALLEAGRSGNAAELRAADRRASAFLRRMRGADAKGEQRQDAQLKVSKARIERDAEQGKID